MILDAVGVCQPLFDLAIGRKGRALLRILLVVPWGVPPLHLGASEDQVSHLQPMPRPRFTSCYILCVD